MFLFPRRGFLARAQADDHLADADRLPRLQRQVTRDAVALVEQADHRDALRHRRFADELRWRAAAGAGAGLGRGRLLAAVARGDEERGNEDRNE